MPDGRNNRRFAGKRGAGDRLAVEHPQILARAAAARDDDHIHPAGSVQTSDGVRDFGRSLAALYGNGCKQKACHGIAPARYIQNILQGRPGFGGDQPDAVRHRGQGLFVFFGKQALPFQLFLQLLKRQLHCADPVRKQVFRIYLKRAVPFKKRDPAAHDHTHPILRQKAKLLRLTPEHYGLHRALLVF